MTGEHGPLERPGGQQPMEKAVPAPMEHAVPPAPVRKTREEFVCELEAEQQFRPERR